jgi:hypothetical protein
MSRIFCIVFAICCFAVSVSGERQAIGQTFTPENFTDQRFLQYEQQLNAILKTRRDEERQFINELVLKVREGKLPSKLIQTSFRWVQKKRPQTNFPFIYFEKVLRLQADRAGIANTIPAYNFDIYRQFDNGVRPYIRGGSKSAQGPGLSSDKSTFRN